AGIMIEVLATFHFLRPEWFYALVPALLLFLILRARNARDSNWSETIDAGLLPYLLDDPGKKSGQHPLTLLLVAWLIAIIALAGPVFRKSPQPVHERADALVVILDLTRSMYAEDVSPNRLVRAKRKLRDLLARRDEGVTALVVFAGDAHTVAPLTDDIRTITEMIPAISPDIMPSPGSRLAPALTLAVTLFEDAGFASGRILILTDEIRDLAEAQVVARRHRYAYPVSVLAVGTAQGAPIPTGDGYLKDASGVMVIPRVDFANLQGFANLAGGRFARMDLTDEDLDYLLAEDASLGTDDFRELERNFDVWIEEGPWLLLFLLPLAALAFRRGWLWSLPLLLILPGEPAHASLWDDLWKTHDQQAMEALRKGDAASAAQLFEEPAWQATARYRSENYSGAAKQFAQIDSVTARYNQGNALARLGQYADAIAAYEQALALDPDNEDAAFNKELVENLLKNQQQQQQQDGDPSDQQDQDQKKDQQQNQEQNQNQSDQGEDQQDQQQPSQDQQDEPGEEQPGENEDQTDSEQEQGEQPLAEDDVSPLNEEEQQALDQWLRRVPDDPGGLLRRKFELQHAERMRQGGNGNNHASNW
ncbi:MAG: VWA domain-containing protein, partial [Pseudomonadales bacterium]